MRVIIAGPRTFYDYPTMCKAIEDSGFDITTVVCGMATGADSLGHCWAVEHNIPIDEHPAQWSVFGKRAGYVRNEAMANVADALIAIDSGSPGTRNMITIAKAKGLKIHTHKTYSPK